MSIENLKSKIKALGVFDEGSAIQEYEEQSLSSEIYVDSRKRAVYMAKWQHAKSARMAEMLLECVEALEFYADADNYHVVDNGRNYIQKLEVEDYESSKSIETRASELLKKLAKGAE